jgi:hypothetical protein
MIADEADAIGVGHAVGSHAIEGLRDDEVRIGFGWLECLAQLDAPEARRNEEFRTVGVDVQIAIPADVRFDYGLGRADCVGQRVGARGEADERWREGGTAEIAQEFASIDCRNESSSGNGGMVDRAKRSGVP